NIMCEIADRIRKEGKQEGIKEGIEEGIKAGIKEGIKEGESLLASLLNHLFADGRTEDVKRAVADAAARSKLYEEYGIA
ncbi:MAG: transposase, partial [Blautia sp.]|nr:transposase [Blautia sp.]